MSKKIVVILGSVRPKRAGKSVADWVMRQTQKYQGNVAFELVDLKELNLPFLDEPLPPMMSDEYQQEHTKRWSEKVSATDGFVIVTPEYNHGYPPALKNAFDFLYKEWKGKPVGFVGYGGSGARDSIRQFTEILTFMEMKVQEERVSIGEIWAAFDEEGNVSQEHVRGDIQHMLAQIERAL